VGTVFGAADLGGLVAQLNTWAPQVEAQMQQVLGTAMVVEGRVQQLSEGGAMELRNIVVAFRNELDARTASRVASNEALKEEFRMIVGRVHEKFVEVEAAMDRVRAAVTTTTTPTTTTSGAAAPPMQDPWAAAAAADRSGMGAGAAPTTSATSTAGLSGFTGPMPPGFDSKYRVVHKNWGGHKLLDLDVNPDGFIV
jgi:hypothetical protein